MEYTLRAFPFAEWCRLNRFSKAKGYELLRDRERAPRTYMVGNRRMVGVEADVEWRERMERLSADLLPARTINAEATQAEDAEAAEDEARRREDGEDEEADAETPGAA